MNSVRAGSRRVATISLQSTLLVCIHYMATVSHRCAQKHTGVEGTYVKPYHTEIQCSAEPEVFRTLPEKRLGSKIIELFRGIIIRTKQIYLKKKALQKPLNHNTDCLQLFLMSIRITPRSNYRNGANHYLKGTTKRKKWAIYILVLFTAFSHAPALRSPFTRMMTSSTSDQHRQGTSR